MLILSVSTRNYRNQRKKILYHASLSPKSSVSVGLCYWLIFPFIFSIASHDLFILTGGVVQWEQYPPTHHQPTHIHMPMCDYRNITGIPHAAVCLYNPLAPLWLQVDTCHFDHVGDSVLQSIRRESKQGLFIFHRQHSQSVSQSEK